MRMDVSEKESELIKRRRARPAGQAQPPQHRGTTHRVAEIAGVAVSLATIVAVVFFVIMLVAPDALPGARAATPTMAPPLPTARVTSPDSAPPPVLSGEPAQASIDATQPQPLPTTQPQALTLETAVEDNQVLQSEVPPVPEAPQGAEPQAVTIDHLYPTSVAPTSVLTPEEQQAADASSEAMMLRNACDGLTEAQCAAAAAAAQNDIRIRLAPTVAP